MKNIFAAVQNKIQPLQERLGLIGQFSLGIIGFGLAIILGGVTSFICLAVALFFFVLRLPQFFRVFEEITQQAKAAQQAHCHEPKAQEAQV